MNSTTLTEIRKLRRTPIAALELLSASATPLSYKSLKARHRETKDPSLQDFNLRVHRALSWLRQAEVQTTDADVKFVLLWISFNAAYANVIKVDSRSAREEFNAFFGVMAELDEDKALHTSVWNRFPHEIRLLLNNRYIFQPFWDHYNGVPGNQNYEDRLIKAHVAINKAMKKRGTATILGILFERLYVLRNQVVHGGSTWGSKVNRDQLRDGVRVLSNILPIFISIMIDNPNRDWGKPFYPPVDVE